MSQNDSFLTGKMSRRQVLKLGAAAGAGAFLALAERRPRPPRQPTNC